MSTESPGNLPEPNESQQPNYARRVIAGVTVAAIALVGAVEYKQQDSPGQSAEQTNSRPHTLNTDKAPSTHETNGLGSVRELPGYGKEVSAAERAELKASTVKLSDMFKDSPGSTWEESCTGLKVSIGGQSYVATARHCLEESVSLDGLYPAIGDGSSTKSTPNMYKAQNVTNITFRDFGVSTMYKDGATNDSAHAPVESISVRYYPDIALMKVNEARPESAAYNALPAVPYEQVSDAAPVPGSATAIFSLPTRAGWTMIEGSGTYLGRITDPADGNRQLDLVGINPSGPEKDVCNYGASGSSAVIAGGAFTGPLSLRNNITYEAGSNDGDDPTTDIPARHKIEKSLGLDLKEFSTLCGYSVVTGPIAQDMVHGFAQTAHLPEQPDS